MANERPQGRSFNKPVPEVISRITLTALATMLTLVHSAQTGGVFTGGAIQFTRGSVTTATNADIAVPINPSTPKEIFNAPKTVTEVGRCIRVSCLGPRY